MVHGFCEALQCSAGMEPSLHVQISDLEFTFKISRFLLAVAPIVPFDTSTEVRPLIMRRRRQAKNL